MSQISCLNPRIIINPLASELISQYGNFTFLGITTYLSHRSRNSLFFHFSSRFINPGHHVVTHDELSSCYVTDTSSGESFPLYLEVPCGHCDICKSSKINSFVHRCKLETMTYNSLPIFLTLTYNEKNRPKDGVSLRDVQLFFKRLRINLQRNGYKDKIRYVLVSEYGRPENTSRPHYHAILWNLRQTDFLSYREIVKIIEKSWNHGFCFSRFLDSTDDKAIPYVAKYISKDNNVPDGQNPNFLLASNRGGGIGSRFIDFMSDTIVRELNTRPKFCNPSTGRVEDFYLNRYVLNRVLPSFSHSLPPYLKRNVRDFLQSYRILRDVYHLDSLFDYEFNKVVDFFGRFLYIPSYDDIYYKIDDIKSSSYHLRTCLHCEEALERAMYKGHSYYEKAKEVSKRRDLFLGLMFKYDKPLKCLELRAYNFRRIRSLQKQREVL